MEIVIIILLMVAVATAIVADMLRERKKIERVFYARGYVYVVLCLDTNEVYKGFITRAQLRVIRARSSNSNITLESYRTGDKRVISSNRVTWIRQLKPPE